MMPGDSGSATLNRPEQRVRPASLRDDVDRDQHGHHWPAEPARLHDHRGRLPGSGTPLYNSVLQGAAFGNPAPGDHAGDRVLNGLPSEDLCFAWSLPLLTTGNAFQGATTTATFTFSAEQTANNP